MRVVYDLSILRHPPGGTARYATELLAEMQRQRQVDESVVTTKGFRRLRRGHRHLRLVNAAGDLVWIAVAARVVSSRLRSDVWYSPSNILPRRLGVPMVVTIHDVNFLIAPETYDRRYRTWATAMFKRSAAEAAHILAVSAFSAREISQRLGVLPDRISVAYPGLDHGSLPAPGPGVGSVRRRFALFTGQTDPHKNVGILLEAWRRGVPADLDLVVAGGPGRDDDRLRALAAAPDLRQRVHFLGRVDDRSLARLYADAHCFVFPSRIEGFGLPPLEAMARGIPTAVADRGSLPEVTGDAAIWFDPDDSAALAAIVAEISEEGPLRRRLQTAGPIKAAEYRWQGTAAHVWTAIREARS